jgi:hypothetical protein
VGKMQRRETATEYRFQERHATKDRFIPTDESSAYTLKCSAELHP